MGTRYTGHVGVKYNKDGSLRRFPGNTVVSMMDSNQDVIGHLDYASNSLQEHSFSKKYAFLPRESYHMTIIEGVCDEVREQNRWSNKMSLTDSLDDMNEFFFSCFQKLGDTDDEFSKVSMVFDRLYYDGLILVLLKPADERSERILRGYRDRFSEETGVRFDNHDNYGFHISLGYLIEEFEDNEKEAVDAAMASVSEYLQENLGKISVPKPIFSNFSDMGTFPEYKPQL